MGCERVETKRPTRIRLVLARQLCTVTPGLHKIKMAAADVQKPPVPSYERCEPGSVNLPIATFPRTTNQEPKDADGIASQAVAKFNAALEAGNIQGILNLFCTDCYWRDHLGLSWDLHTLKGKHKIRDFLDATTRGLKKLEIQRNNGFQAPHYGPFDGSGDTKGIEFFVKFETETGRGRGLMRLLEESPNHWYIFSLFTTLEEIIGHEEAVGPRRARGVDHGGFEGRLNWYERRQKSMSYADGAQPTVIILGEKIIDTRETRADIFRCRPRRLDAGCKVEDLGY